MFPWVFSKKKLDQRRNPTSSFDARGCYASHRLKKTWFGRLRTATFWGKSVEFSFEGTKDLVEKKENSEYLGLTRIYPIQIFAHYGGYKNEQYKTILP